ncbi:MAG: hypothetical protein AB1553_09340 [Nitrospirota bacterium]
MSDYLHYILSPLFYFVVSMTGRFFASQGLKPWYRSLTKPPCAPSGGGISGARELV